MKKFLPFLPSSSTALLVLVLLQFYLCVNAQQAYLNNIQLNCDRNYTSAISYLCDNNNASSSSSCFSYLTFRSQPPFFNTPSSIAFLLRSDPITIARINKLSSTNSIIPSNTLLIIPISNCSCSYPISSSQPPPPQQLFYNHKASYIYNNDKETYFSIANNTYEGLTTCQAITNHNPYNYSQLHIGMNISIPLRCACPTPNQTANGIRYLLTYLITWGDSIPSIASSFGVSDPQTVMDANKLSSTDIIFPFTPLLIPLATEPTTIDLFTSYGIYYEPIVTSVNLSTAWKTSPAAWIWTDGSPLRSILFVREEGWSTQGTIKPAFCFGFFSNRSTSNMELFYLVTLLLPRSVDDFILTTPVVVWIANRDRPVQENATLNFTAAGDLQLNDVDGTLVWSTNTSGLSVSRLNFSDGGNLMLVDDEDRIVWQSFDHPTDTWLPGQNIHYGNGLVARNSSTNVGSGQYSLSVNNVSIDAFIGSGPPKLYRSKLFQSRFPGQSRLLNHAALGMSGSIEALSNYARFNIQNYSVDGFRYIVLEPNGHLNVYQLNKVNSVNFDVGLSGDILSDDFFGECDYPGVCGNYGVCSNGQCSCPGGNVTYFTLTQDLQPTLGCTEVIPLTCDSSTQTFLEQRNVTYFDFEPLNSSMDVESCKIACLNNCTCKAALFRYNESLSSGQCSLPSNLYSFTTLNKNIDRYNSYAFIKVQVTPDTKTSEGNKFPLVQVLTPSLSVGILLLFVCGYYSYKIIGTSKSEEEDGDDEVMGTLKRFSFLELKYATEDFLVKLGHGGFGSVFKGELSDGTKVAVKLLDSIGQGRKEFLAEVNTIGSIHHFNLVKLVGFCAEKSNRLLVYEHMSNGSLDKWIFNQEPAQTLHWEIRRKIIVGLAKGLEYLHFHCNPNIIHFDIKPQNILLDADFNVKISDFGLARLIDRDQSQVLTALKGTPGYVAPELFQGTNISVKADVFSFGIVVLEIILGRKNSSNFGPLVNLVKEKAEKDELLDVLDENTQSHKEEVVKMINVAVRCLQAHNRRPHMSTVLKVLEGLIDLECVEDQSDLTLQETLDARFLANTISSSGKSLPVASILSGPR